MSSNEIVLFTDSDAHLVVGVEQGNELYVKEALHRNANPDILLPSGNTAIGEASMKGHINIMKLLKDAGADPLSDGNGRSPALSLAVYGEQEEAVRLLLSWGAYPAQPVSSYDCMPLTIATWTGNINIMKLLIKSEPKSLVNTSQQLWSPLIVAAGSGRVDLVKVLLDSNAAITTKAIFAAARQGHAHCLLELLTRISCSTSQHYIAHTDINKYIGELTLDDKLLLLEAAARGHADVLTVLTSFTHILDRREAQLAHRTALIICAENGHLECARALLIAGADTNLTDREGNTALHVAAAHGNMDLCTLLLSHATNVTIVNNKGKDAVAVALTYGHMAVADTIRRHRARESLVVKNIRLLRNLVYYTDRCVMQKQRALYKKQESMLPEELRVRVRLVGHGGI